MEEYPEHDKLAKVSDQSQACGGFLEWLEEQSILLAKHHHHSENCRCGHRWHLEADPMRYSIEGCPSCGGDPSNRRYRCGYLENDLVPLHTSTVDLLSEFFCIDQSQLENEKRAMLELIREAAQHNAS